MGCTVLYFILPETEGKKLNEIENHFTGIRKLTNQVYRSKVCKKSYFMLNIFHIHFIK